LIGSRGHAHSSKIQRDEKNTALQHLCQEN
jgi:hypothetical protein